MDKKEKARQRKAKSRANQTAKERHEQKVYESRLRATVRSNHTPEQVEQQRSYYCRRYREKRQHNFQCNTAVTSMNNKRNKLSILFNEVTSQAHRDSINEETIEEHVPKISSFVEIRESQKKAFNHLMKTKVGHEETHSVRSYDDFGKNGENSQIFCGSLAPSYEQYHQANVCVCCDRFICGTEELCWIKKAILLKHRSRLKIPDLPHALRQCYQVHDMELHELLLSPRARVKRNGEYLCCAQCFKAFRSDNLDNNPPKYAISNNFAIGNLPQTLGELLTEVTSPLLSHVRPFAYVVSYSGGAHKAITGSFSFFSQTIEKNIGALNYHSNVTNQSNIFVVMAGNFTPMQRHIVKHRCLVDINNLKTVYNWLRENNVSYHNLPEFHECPSPIIMEDEDSLDEESANPTIEKHIEIKYWFPNNGDPTSSNSIFNSQPEFIDNLLKNKEPTLLFSSRNYEIDHKLTLPIIFPLHFPFGTGGLEEGRRSHVSVEECLKHYLKISLPMFQHADIILVIAHMYFRKKSFQSAYLRCMSKSSIQGVTRGEALSRITEEELMSISKNTKLNTPVQGQENANHLIHTVTASCKNLPFCDEAAKEARSKLFSMWYTFGPPAVFFTISPGDECSFRIKLSINTTMTLLPQLNVPENDCVADLLYRSEIRINNPGACAREYNCIMQIIMECLIGWDFTLRKQTSNGIFGKVLGWCDTTEEQARYTLHSHVLLFIHGFDEVLNMLWSRNEAIRDEAKAELVKYMKATMNSSYKLLEEDFVHVTPKITNAETVTCAENTDQVVGEISEVSFCRIIPKPVCNGNLMKMRHERCCHVFKGFVGRCEGCKRKFTTLALVWNAISSWNKQFEDSCRQNFFKAGQTFPLTKELVDRVALRFPYDMEYLSRFPNEKLKKILFTVVLHHYNEHDYRHRKGCFKKNEECRFHYPRKTQDCDEVNIDFKAEFSTWYSSYGNGNNKKCFPFTMDSKRDLPDVYLNTHNVTVSETFGFNNNVSMGNRNCIYYVTLYSTKGNQEEEQFPFLRHCNAIAKRLRKLRSLENQISNQLEFNGHNEISSNLEVANFKVGLGHVLSGIMAHVSTNVISATMAWHLVMNDSRFTFSHDFSHILLSQFEGWLLGDDINFRYRRNKNKREGWIDSNLFQYIYRPMREEFEDTSVWEFFKKYEMRLISSLTANQKENLDSDFEENMFFNFAEDYPGYEFACLATMKHEKVPMLYYKDHIPDLESCKIDRDDDSIDDDVKKIRNDYATKMLILFYPFREKCDFPCLEDRWTFFKDAHDRGMLYSDATRIMQNFQDVENSKKIISTSEKEVGAVGDNMEIDQDLMDEIGNDVDNNHNTSSSTIVNNEYDLDLILEEYAINEELGDAIEDSLAKNSCGHLKKAMKTQHIINDPICSNDSIIVEEITDVEDFVSDPAMIPNAGVDLATGNLDIITVILDVNRIPSQNEPPWSEMERTESLSFKDYPLAMHSCIRHYNLDVKQASAFKVICSSFMLSHLYDPSVRKNISDTEIEKAAGLLKKMGGLERLIMNLTGSGGSGKSFVLDAIKAFCKQFCRVVNKPFDDSVFIITATTNTAAAQLKGDTIHSIAGLRRKMSSILKNWTINWALAKILFIDEISMMDIMDFLKMDKYLRRLMAQFNPQALDLPFGGLNVIFCGDFSQLNPVGQKDLIYDQAKNVLWNLINRQINLTLGNWRFKNDTRWGDVLDRFHHGEATMQDLELINTRVVGPQLSLPTLNELQAGDISYACYTNADRNLITDNIFARILESRHPKAGEDWQIPHQTIIIKGIFYPQQGNEQKSTVFHKLIHGNCGDDNVLCGNGQNIIRVDPCLKLYVGCPIMVSVNDFKKNGVVKGTTGKFKGVVLKQNRNLKEELWNGFKVYTVDACDVKEIICEYTCVKESDPRKTFRLPVKVFDVSIKFPIGNGKRFFTLKKNKIVQFPINNDLATTGHKLQGMTKKYLIVSQLNYSTPNWIYVVLSRVTTLDGLFLLQPIKLNFNARPSKLLRDEWIRQRAKELELLKFLQQNDNLPVDLNIEDIALKLTTVQQQQTSNTIAINRLVQGKKKKPLQDMPNANPSMQNVFPMILYNLWFTKKNMVIRSDLSEKKGNCLFDSVSSFFSQWKGKSIELRMVSIRWAMSEVTRGSFWGINMWQNFENTLGDIDRYNAGNYMAYLNIVSDHRVFATEYDVLMLCEFLKVTIQIYSPNRFTMTNGELECPAPLIVGNYPNMTIALWLKDLHYEPIMDISSH